MESEHQLWPNPGGNAGNTVDQEPELSPEAVVDEGAATVERLKESGRIILRALPVDQLVEIFAERFAEWTSGQQAQFLAAMEDAADAARQAKREAA